MALDAKMISRTDADALIPVEYSREIIQNVPQRSRLLPMMRRLPNMSSKQYTIPVLATLPQAAFVNGEANGTTNTAGQKTTTNAEWDGLTLTAEELAVIVPIPEAVLADADYDIWGELRPQIEEAFGIAIDAAILNGTNKPTSWPTAIIPGAEAAGNTVEVGTNKDLASDIIGVGGDLRTTDNSFLYIPSMTSGVPSTILGRPVQYDNQGIFDTTEALMIAGDFTKAVYSIRQDMTYKVLTEAVIQNTDGTIAYNLAQQDMVALRCVMRLGVQIANPITRANATSSTRYPFAVLTPKAST